MHSFTSDLKKAQIRLFSRSHENRNQAEYEGYFEVDEQLLSELIISAEELKKIIDGIKL